MATITWDIPDNQVDTIVSGFLKAYPGPRDLDDDELPLHPEPVNQFKASVKVLLRMKVEEGLRKTAREQTQIQATPEWLED